MASNNALVLYQVTFYVLSLVLSICVFLPIGFHLYDFKGHCLLFTNGTWRETDGQFVGDWASQAFCDFNIGWALFTLVLALTQLHRFIGYLCSDTDANFLSAFFDVLTSFFLCLGTLAGAIIITMGYQTWCDAIMQRFEKCEDASINSILKDEGIDTTMFYTQFGTAQFGAWCLWVCCVGLSVVSLLKVCKYHQIENIRASMVHDRARLISEQPSNSLNA